MKKISKNKFIWLSGNLFGYELLKEALKIKGIKILGVITLSPKSTTKVYDGIERKKWYEFNIPVYEIENINKEEKLFKSLTPDFVIMAGWRQIISENILKIPSKGFIGFHPALLPKDRGSAPIINTILTGLKKSGVTMFYVNEGTDSGDIIGQVKFDVSDNDYAGDIYQKVIQGGKELIKRFLPLLVKDTAPRIPQRENEATYFPKRSLKDNEINLNNTSPEDIYKKIRALSKPYNGAYIKIKNKKIIIWRAQLENDKT